VPTIICREQTNIANYFLMTSLVVPRPIAWISTLGTGGVPNLAPYSHFNNCSANPPIIMFSSNGVKDTLRNIRDSGEFVVNIVSHELRHQMRVTSANWPSDVSEFEQAGLSSAPSRFVRPPRVAAARAAMECKLREILPMGDCFVVFGDVQCFHVADELMVDGRVIAERLQAVGKLDGALYSTVTSTERLDLPPAMASQVDDYGASWGKGTR
jgi:flavin reductase (DIM6/NTAB) family NADH-FMN oxidoreductase RutF